MVERLVTAPGDLQPHALRRGRRRPAVLRDVAAASPSPPTRWPSAPPGACCHDRGDPAPAIAGAGRRCLAIVAYAASRSRRPDTSLASAAWMSDGVERSGTLRATTSLIDESGRSRFGAVLYRAPRRLFERLRGLSGLGDLPEIRASSIRRPERWAIYDERLLRAGEQRLVVAGRGSRAAEASRAQLGDASERWRAFPPARAVARGRGPGGPDLRRRAPDPDARRQLVLDALDAAGARATFFLVLRAARLRNIALGRGQLTSRGHEVARCSTASHTCPTTTRDAASRARRSGARARDGIEVATGRRPRRLLQSPYYGRSFTEHSYAACGALELEPVYWSAWGGDWEDIDVAARSRPTWRGGTSRGGAICSRAGPARLRPLFRPAERRG